MAVASQSPAQRRDESVIEGSEGDVLAMPSRWLGLGFASLRVNHLMAITLIPKSSILNIAA